jgi:precorrin-6B C5,15-methyltransferase / cobalt-precorrin-6B C5,C15-methyltransferase
VPERIVVSGVGPAGPEARERLEPSSAIAAGARLLARWGNTWPSARHLEIGGDLSRLFEAMDGVDGQVGVLASGDPGFFGIVRALGERYGRSMLEVHPAPSSVSLAFARLGLSWDDAVVISAHGRELDVQALRRAPKAAVLTGPECGPEMVGEALAGLDRQVAVAARIGEPDERTEEVDLEGLITKGPWPEPNVVVVWRRGSEFGAKGRAWAASEERFAHRAGMITKSEVRAVALARLGPGPGVVMWDVGAGSGSVAIEAALLGSDVWAVERPPAEELRANAPGAPGVRVVEGEAPGILAGLPDPEAVFVGGGGVVVVGACARRKPDRIVVTLASVDRVAPARDALLGYEVEVTLLQAWRGADLGGGLRLAPQNPVFLVTGEIR